MCARRAKRQQALLLFAGLPVLVRNLRLLPQATERGFAVIVVAPQSDSVDRLQQRVSDPQHPLHEVWECHVIQPLGHGEGNFNSAALPVVTEIASRYDIRATFSLGETLVEPAGIAADLLGLPSAGLRATRVSRSKYLQRSYIPEFAPEHVVVHPKERAHISRIAPAGELVVKPSGRFSSSGVVAVSDRADLPHIVAGYPDDEVLLVESRVHGPEFSVESLIHCGEILFSSVTEKKTSESDGSCFVETAHTILARPSHPDWHRRLLSANARVAARLDIQNSFMHAEFRMTDAGPVLMEVAVRPPGDGIMMLYTLATGQPFDELLLPLYSAEPIDIPVVSRCARQVYVHGENGVLENIKIARSDTEVWWLPQVDLWPTLHPAAPDALARLCVVAALQPRGATVQAMRDSHDRIATFLLDGPTAESLDELEKAVRGQISVSLKPERAPIQVT
jgi:hypothetical protein